MNRSNINPLLILLLAFATIFRIEAQDIDNQHVSYPFTKKSLTTLQELLAIPNDAKYPNDIEKNVVWCEEQLAAADFSTKRLETATVLFYFHIDGQPVDPQYCVLSNRGSTEHKLGIGKTFIKFVKTNQLII